MTLYAVAALIANKQKELGTVVEPPRCVLQHKCRAIRGVEWYMFDLAITLIKCPVDFLMFFTAPWWFLLLRMFELCRCSIDDTFECVARAVGLGHQFQVTVRDVPPTSTAPLHYPSTRALQLLSADGSCFCGHHDWLPGPH